MDVLTQMTCSAMPTHWFDIQESLHLDHFFRRLNISTSGQENKGVPIIICGHTARLADPMHNTRAVETKSDQIASYAPTPILVMF